ncbi:MAG: MFS transporter [Candidatus Promineifilaceae bacterium]
MTTNPPTTIEKMRGLRWNTLADSANTIFAQFTFFGSVFILFLSALGLSKGQIGFMLSLFPFAGLIAPFIAPRVARFGYKRTFLTFWGIRKAITVFLLFVPLVMARFGENITMLYVVVIVGGFALCRAAAETGKYPWSQEFVPNHVRGKYSAVSNVFTTVAGLAAVAVAGFVLDRSDDLSGYILLIGIGIFFGLVGFWGYSHIPGGAPTIFVEEKQRRAIHEALIDKNFRRFLIGIALMTLATAPMTTFLPLFMQEKVGLSDSQVVLLQNGSLIGGLLLVYLWGWAADRFGSTPVMLSGILVYMLLPVLWLIMPRQSALSLYVALGIAFLQGMAGMGWAIGSARLLFVSVVPAEKKADYMALYYAWIGVVGGVSQIVGGWLLEGSRNLSGEFLSIEIDAYTPLFLMGLVLPLVGFVVLRQVQVDNEVGMGEFAGILFRGNPFIAVESMIRYHFAKDEQAVVLSTEKLGQAKSLLTIEELLESLHDPRFNVRFEAITAIGRSRPDERLTNALAEILHGTDPALSVMAAWALGRMGAEGGQSSLQKGLDSDYRSIRAHSARSLATLGDKSVIDLLRKRLRQEKDHGLKVAYAASLGQLQDTAVTPILLSLLYQETQPMARAELALALARLLGSENKYIQMLRQTRADLDTAASQIILSLSKKLSASPDLIAECVRAFSTSQHDEGISKLVPLVQEALEWPLPAPNELILQECLVRLPQFGVSREEYLLLLFHSLNTADTTTPPQ